MRKYSWLIAFTAIFSLALFGFASCKNDGGEPDPDPDKVEITWNANGGAFAGDQTTRTQEIDEGATVTAPIDATRADHDLVGWNTSADGSGTAHTATRTHNTDTTYYAMWVDNVEREVVQITFNAGEEGVFDTTGLGVSMQSTNISGRLESIPSASRDGYRLVGWNTAADGSGTTLTLQTIHLAATTYHAIWEQDSFDVTYSWDFSEVEPVKAIDSNNVNIWNLTGEILDAIRDAEPGSVLRLHFDATGGRTADPPPAPGNERSGWSIGSIGTATSAADANVIGLWTPPDTGWIYYVDVELDWALDLLGDGDKLSIFAPHNNGDMLQKVELLEPMEGRVPGVRPVAPVPPTDEVRAAAGGNFIAVLPITFGYFGDVTVGKGEITGAPIQQIRDAIDAVTGIDTVVLRVWVRNTLENDRLSWGVGQINGEGVLSGSNGILGEFNNRSNDIPHTQILSLLNIRNSLDLNPYNQHAITLVELLVITPPYANVTLVDWQDNETAVIPVILTGRNVAVTPLDDNSGYQFIGTGGGHRGKFVHFPINLGDKKLSDFASISFDFQVFDTLFSAAGAGRRLGLMAQAIPYANVSLPNHQTTNDSSGGFLASYQVTFPMGANVNPVDAAEKITLNINPTYAHTLDSAETLYLSIYEHTDAAANVRISNIVFKEHAPGCYFHPGEDTIVNCPDCTDDINAVKALIEGTTFKSDSIVSSNLAAATASAQTLVNALALNNVVATVVPAANDPYTAVTGDAITGTAGSFRFTVKLGKGNGTDAETDELEMEIENMALELGVVWKLADYFALNLARWTDEAFVFGSTGGTNTNLEPYDGWRRMGSSATNFGPIHTSSGTANTHLLVMSPDPNPYLVTVNSNNTQQFNIIIGTAQRGLGLKTRDLQYRMRITGSAVGGTVSFQVDINGVDLAPGETATFVPLANHDGTFSIDVLVPKTAVNPTAAGSVIRFQPRTAGGGIIRIDNIEFELIGFQPTP